MQNNVFTLTVRSTGYQRSVSVNIIEPVAKILVHFRRPSNYENNGNTLEYGFDWLRDEYIYPISGTALCSNIETLKNEYIDTIKPFDKDYYISWLNIRKNQTVTLDLEIEELEEIGNTDTTKIVFESSNEHITVNRPSIKLSELLTNGKQTKVLDATTTRKYYLASASIEVSCSDVYSEHQHISVFAETTDGKVEVGKIKLYNNSEAYRLKARFVEVKFKGKIEQPLTNFDGLMIAMKHNFNANTATVSVPSMPNVSREEKLKQSEKINDWKNYVVSTEKLTKEKFIQANIEYTVHKKEKSIEYRELEVNFGNFKIDNKPAIESGTNRIKNSITSIDVDSIACNMEDFLQGISELYENEYGEESGVIFFIMPITIRYSNPPAGQKVDYLDGFAEDVFSEGKYILLANNNNRIRNSTIVHETAHTLGLFHSFQTETVDHGRPIIPEHTFRYQTTENIMDYSIKTFSFWKYQWDKMRLDNHDLELIQP